jgi:electron transport complex protein RnfG
MTEQTETDSTDSSPTLGQSMFKSAWGLSIFAIITAGLIALTQVGTQEKIAQQIKQARSKALLEIVPLQQFNNDLLEDAFWLDPNIALGLSDPAEAFIATLDNIPTHIILPLIAPEGYSGPIRLVLSIDIGGTIKGLRVIEHKETPGLGDKIDLKKSDWILGFNKRSLDNTPSEAWRVKKDDGEFDQLTGATITPRAIVRAVYQALIFYRDNKTALLEQALQAHLSKAAVSHKKATVSEKVNMTSANLGISEQITTDITNAENTQQSER